MSKINKTIKYGVVSSLILLGILAFGVITLMPKEANAATYKPYNEPEEVKESIPRPDNPIPFVSSISPDSGNLGSGAKTVTISGNGFVPGSVARINGADRPTTFIDASHLLIHLYGSDMVGASGRYVTVWNPGPGGGFSNGVLFTINGYVTPSASTSSVRTNTSTNTSTNSGSVRGTSTTNNAEESRTNDDFSSLASNTIYGSNGFMPSGLVQWLLFAILILLIVIIVRKLYGADKYHAEPLKHA